jgi:hypothetical protein
MKTLTSEELKINEMMKKMGYEVEPGYFINISNKMTYNIIVKVY